MKMKNAVDEDRYYWYETEVFFTWKMLRFAITETTIRADELICENLRIYEIIRSDRTVHYFSALEYLRKWVEKEYVKLKIYSIHPYKRHPFSSYMKHHIRSIEGYHKKMPIDNYQRKIKDFKLLHDETESIENKTQWSSVEELMLILSLPGVGDWGRYISMRISKGPHFDSIATSFKKYLESYSNDNLVYDPRLDFPPLPTYNEQRIEFEWILKNLFYGNNLPSKNIIFPIQVSTKARNLT